MAAFSPEEGLQLLYQHGIIEALYEGNIDLKLRAILAIPGVIEEFERSQDLPIGNLAEMVQHYGEKYYTANCEMESTPYRCFVRAAASGYVDIVRKYLDEPSIGYYGEALFEAGKYNRKEIIYLLADYPELAYNEPMTMATDGAAVGGHFDLVDELRQWAGSPSQALRILSETGNVDRLNAVIQRFPNVNWDRIMEAAAWGGHIDLVKYAITQGASSFNSGLARAVQGNHLDIINLMLAHGANISSEPESVWYFAAENGNLELINYFQTLSPINNQEIVEGAAAGVHITLIQMYYTPGMDLKHAMEKAAENGQINTITYLLSLDSSLEVLNGGLVGALKREISNKYEKRQLVKFFIDAGANDWEGAISALEEFYDIDQELVDFFNHQLNPT